MRESISTEKMGSILKYLDEVETQTDVDMGSVTTVGNISEQMESMVPSPTPSVQSARSSDAHHRSQQCYSDIKGKVVALTVELNVRAISVYTGLSDHYILTHISQQDKTETIEILKQARKKDKDQFDQALHQQQEEAQVSS